MEALSEREKEVLLSEIQQIRAVLHPEHDSFGVDEFLSSDEEEENADNSNENQSGMYIAARTSTRTIFLLFRPEAR